MLKESSIALPGDIQIIKLLLAANADVNAIPKYDITSLGIASLRGHTEIVKILLNAKADVNNHKTNQSFPLFIAACKCRTEIVKLLLEANANVNTKAHWQGKIYTPLSIAREEGYTEIIRLLKEYGAKE